MSTYPSSWAVDMGNRQTDLAFGKFPSGKSVFQTVLDVIFGGGFCVSNYFAIDPNTGQIYVAATAEDTQDGKEDGKSDDGAIYRIELTPGAETTTQWSLAIKKSALFPGGTGSTPTVDSTSQRLLGSDDHHHVLSLDPMELSTLWSVDVGAQVAASIAVAPEGDIYCVTAKSVVRIRETSRTSAEIVWIADLSAAYPGFKVVNALTPTIVANGVVISAAATLEVPVGKGASLMLKVGSGLLDRETGKLRYFAEGVEESIAVSVVAADGSKYTGSSPVRRAISTGIFAQARPLSGGITRYKPVRLDVLARDAICAAWHRCERAAQHWPQEAVKDAMATRAASVAEVRQVVVLLLQARTALAAHVARELGNGSSLLRGAKEAADLDSWLAAAADALAVPADATDEQLPHLPALIAAEPMLQRACSLLNPQSPIK